jgi:hypothetical protein
VTVQISHFFSRVLPLAAFLRFLKTRKNTRNAAAAAAAAAGTKQHQQLFTIRSV